MGEISVAASSGGRPLTLDPIKVTPKRIFLPRKRVETTIPCGFQVNWVDVDFTGPDGEKWTADLSSGAGLGSRYMTVAIRDGEGKVYGYECVDIGQVLEKWLDAMLTEGRSPTIETRDGVTAILDEHDGAPVVTCMACGAALVDDDRSPFYDAETDDGTPHVCPTG